MYHHLTKKKYHYSFTKFSLLNLLPNIMLTKTVFPKPFYFDISSSSALIEGAELSSDLPYVPNFSPSVASKDGTRIPFVIIARENSYPTL